MLGRRMEAEIRDQPSVLAGNSGRYFEELRAAFEGRRFEAIVLAARGSSDNAALYARYLIEIHLGVPAVLAAPSVWTRYGRRVKYPNCLAVGISQSGEAPDVAEVVGALREDGHSTLAVTNTPGSPLAAIAETTLALEAGEERCVAATKTYTASLLAVFQLVRALGAELGDPVDSLPSEQWTETARESASASSGALLRSHLIFALARGYGFCTAQEAGLKLMECALLACKSYSSADFQHGPKALAGPGTAAILFGDPIEGLAEQGCEIVTAPRLQRAIAPPLLPLWDAVFAQWLALLCARARGLDADDPRHLQKITRTL